MKFPRLIVSFPEAYCEFSHLAVFSGHERAQKAIPAHRGPSGELLLEGLGLEGLLLLKEGFLMTSQVACL